MSRPDLEGKLTPAAKEAIDELMDEYRSQILIGARASANQLGEVREISLHDVLVSLNRVQLRARRPSNNVLYRLAAIYLVLGLLFGAGGLVGFVYPRLVQGVTLREQLPLMLSVVGLLVAALSYTYLQFASARYFGLPVPSSPDKSGSIEGTATYLSHWRDLELALREAAATRMGESAASAPISALLNRLLHYGLFSDADAHRVRDLLSLRNGIVHEGRFLDPSHLKTALRDAEQITSRLKVLSGETENKVEA